MPAALHADWPTIGARVALARRTAGLGIAELADRVEIERAALERVEAGSRNLSATELAGLAQATELPIAWFVLDSPPSSPGGARPTCATRRSSTSVLTCLSARYRSS